MPRAYRHPALLAASAAAWLALSVGGLARAGDAGDIMTLPSGLSASLQDIIWDEDDRIARFRFIAPDLPAALDAPALLEDDLMALCDAFAAPLTRALQPGWGQVVLSLATAPVAFGHDDPAVTQVFEGFDLDGRDCAWGAF